MDTDLKSIFLYNLITEYMKGVSIMPKIYDLEYKEYVSRMVVGKGENQQNSLKKRMKWK